MIFTYGAALTCQVMWYWRGYTPGLSDELNDQITRRVRICGRLLLHTSRVVFSVPIVYALGNDVQVMTPPPGVDSGSSAFWEFTVEKV